MSLYPVISKHKRFVRGGFLLLRVVKFCAVPIIATRLPTSRGWQGGPGVSDLRPARQAQGGRAVAALLAATGPLSSKPDHWWPPSRRFGNCPAGFARTVRKCPWSPRGAASIMVHSSCSARTPPCHATPSACSTSSPKPPSAAISSPSSRTGGAWTMRPCRPSGASSICPRSPSSFPTTPMAPLRASASSRRITRCRLPAIRRWARRRWCASCTAPAMM